MRAKQRSDRDLGTVHALNYFALKKEKVEEKEEEKRILRNKKRIGEMEDFLR